MENKILIEKQIEKTMELGSTINKVEASPFFKDEMMRQLFPEKERETASIFSWFTPQLQLITLVCFLMINIYALLQYKKSNYDDTISSFAETYELNVSDDLSFFN